MANEQSVFQVFANDGFLQLDAVSSCYGFRYKFTNEDFEDFKPESVTTDAVMWLRPDIRVSSPVSPFCLVFTDTFANSAPFVWGDQLVYTVILRNEANIAPTQRTRFNVYVFDLVSEFAPKTDSNLGLEIFDANGKRVFHSNIPPLKIIWKTIVPEQIKYDAQITEVDSNGNTKKDYQNNPKPPVKSAIFFPYGPPNVTNQESYAPNISGRGGRAVGSSPYEQRWEVQLPPEFASKKIAWKPLFGSMSQRTCTFYAPDYNSDLIFKRQYERNNEGKDNTSQRVNEIPIPKKQLGHEVITYDSYTKKITFKFVKDEPTKEFDYDHLNSEESAYFEEYRYYQRSQYASYWTTGEAPRSIFGVTNKGDRGVREILFIDVTDL